MLSNIPENTAKNLIEIFSEYEDKFDLSTDKGRTSLENHLIEKFKTGNLSIKDGVILGIFNDSFSQKQPKVIFKEAKKGFVDPHPEETSSKRQAVQNKITNYLKIGGNKSTGVSAITRVSNYVTLKNKLIEMGSNTDSPLSFLSRGDFTKSFPQKGDYRSPAVNAIGSIARSVDYYLTYIFDEVKDKRDFLDKFAWVKEIGSDAWNKRIRLAGKSTQDWLGSSVKSPPISDPVNPSLHFQTLQRGLQVIQDPDVKNFIYLKFFIPTRTEQFKNLTYGKGTLPYYDPDKRMIVFESDTKIDKKTGVSGSKTLGKKHYFNFIVSDHIHNILTRINQSNIESGLLKEKNLFPLFPTLHNTDNNTKILNEIRRPGGLFELTNTNTYKKKWQRDGLNDVTDLRKWAYSFYEGHFSKLNNEFRKGLDQSMGHKLSNKDSGTRYGGKGSIKNTWVMEEFKDLLIKFERELLGIFLDIHKDELPTIFKIKTGDLPAIFSMNPDLKDSPAVPLYLSDYSLDPKNFKSSGIGHESSGSVLSKVTDRADLRLTISKDLQVNSLVISDYLKKLETIAENLHELPENVYAKLISKIPFDKLSQDQIKGAFDDLLQATQTESITTILEDNNITEKARKIATSAEKVDVDTPAAAAAEEVVDVPPTEVTRDPKKPLPDQTINWQQKVLENLKKPNAIKKLVLFGASALSPAALLIDTAAEAAIIEAYQAGRDILNPELSDIEEDLGGLKRIDPLKYDSPYFESLEEEDFLGVDDDPDFRSGIPSEGRYDELAELRRMGLPLQKYHFTDEPRPLEQYRGHIQDISRISDEYYDPDKERLAEKITGIKHFGPKLQNIRGDEDRFLSEMQGELSDEEVEYAKYLRDEKYPKPTPSGSLREELTIDPFTSEGELKPKEFRGYKTC